MLEAIFDLDPLTNEAIILLDPTTIPERILLATFLRFDENVLGVSVVRREDGLIERVIVRAK